MSTHFKQRMISTWLLALLLALVSPQTVTAAEPNVWEAFNNGEAVALMRHAIAPGNGDPVEFKLGDCTTQRNLSNDGVLQAQQIGSHFKEHGVAKSDLFSSQWCRCVDTAVNLKMGPVEQLPMLNSFYQNRSTETAQTEQLNQWIVDRLTAKSPNSNNDLPSNTPAILVTHQVNITALTGVFPASGEVVFVAMENDQLTVLATWLAGQ